MMRRVALALMALALVWAGGCADTGDESAWTASARPLLERAEAVGAELGRDDFDAGLARSLISETWEALADYEPADEHGAEFEQLIRDAMDDYASGLTSYETKLPVVGRQWIDQADETVDEARQLLERYEQE